MKMTDAEMAEFYEDPKNREPAGPLFRRRSKKDWVEDASMTREERVEKFDSLDPVELTAPQDIIAELKKERDRLRAGLFMIHQKYDKDNIGGIFENTQDLLINIQADIVLIMDKLDITEWAGKKALELWSGLQWKNLLLQEEKDKWQEVELINGPAKGFKFSLQEAPKRLLIGETTYERIDDPDTEEFLGGYAVVNDGKS